jgi:hypothetical protein
LDDGGALVVLCEEELVVIDLISPKWPSYSLPYLSPIHSSALTACNVVEVKKEIVSKITELGKIEKEKLSKRPWPIKGGHDLSKVLNENKSRDESMQNILLTGHEDGSVRIWSLDKNQMKEIAKITSMKYFETGNKLV